MSQLDKSISNQNPPTTAESTQWDTTTDLPLRSLESNALEDSNDWRLFYNSTAPLSEANSDPMSRVGDINYSQGLDDANFNSFTAAAAMNPSPMSGVGDYDPGFMAHMNPYIPGRGHHTSGTSQASPFISIDDSGDLPSFNHPEPTTQPTPSTVSGNIAWTKEEDKCLMSLKIQGLSYSDIQDEMRKEFGWTRNKNVLGKRFAILKKRSKPHIKARIFRDISKRLTPEIVKDVAKELQKITPSDRNNIAAELEDEVHLKLPQFLENLAADVFLSHSQAGDDDDHELSE
ncbi:hypothetical protein KAF25_005479 [Fusarium avenaceum]|uniref:Myb-like domain-containing protein n=1 Tax=Fusarium avenaceum TaxID=40199 RepID=A0A9P7HAI3_9HYPO|nr:hypothetical protein KAF25_005479 [Fusarium avenaceum]